MKWTTLICCSYLVLFGIFAAIYAFTGFSVPEAVCFGNQIAYRALLSLAGVCALWLLFWLIAFKPTKYLS